MTNGNLNNSQPCEDLVIFSSASFGWFPPGFGLFPNTYSLIITYLKTQECSEHFLARMNVTAVIMYFLKLSGGSDVQSLLRATDLVPSCYN